MENELEEVEKEEDEEWEKEELPVERMREL